MSRVRDPEFWGCVLLAVAALLVATGGFLILYGWAL